jgi:hypothetical protein
MPLVALCYDSKLVRPEIETIYDSLGQAMQRRDLAQVESSTDVYRTECITGVAAGVPPSGGPTLQIKWVTLNQGSPHRAQQFRSTYFSMNAFTYKRQRWQWHS